jgi:hypothetical protein
VRLDREGLSTSTSITMSLGRIEDLSKLRTKSVALHAFTHWIMHHSHAGNLLGVWSPAISLIYSEFLRISQPTEVGCRAGRAWQGTSSGRQHSPEGDGACRRTIAYAMQGHWHTDPSRPPVKVVLANANPMNTQLNRAKGVLSCQCQN